MTWFWIAFVIVLILWILTPTKAYREALRRQEEEQGDGDS